MHDLTERCRECNSGFCPIPFDGPKNARIVACAERPGQQEQYAALKAIRTGIVPEHLNLVGQTGEEWNRTYLRLAGLDRADIRCGNSVVCGKDNNRKPSSKEVAMCSELHLKGELLRTMPEVLFLMGATACSLVSSIQLDVDHGIPFWHCGPKLWGWQGWIVPIHHPASGLHNTGDMTHMMEDWKKVGEWLDSGEWMWPIDNVSTDYRLVTTVDEVDRYFMKYQRRLVGLDTESHAGMPWSIQVSAQPGTAIMVRVGNENECPVTALGYWLTERELVLHNSKADLWIEDRFEHKYEYRDSMQEAYHLQNLPQALKELGYRLFGVRMRSWHDLVTPHSKEKLREWIDGMIAVESTRPIRETVQLKTKIKEVVKPNANEKWLRHLAKHSDSETYDPWDEGRMEKLEGLSGWPVKGIANCPLDEAVQYAARDADMTLRLALWLEQERTRTGSFGVQEEDYDVLVQ